jgi:hypothetical protein
MIQLLEGEMLATKAHPAVAKTQVQAKTPGKSRGFSILTQQDTSPFFVSWCLRAKV